MSGREKDTMQLASVRELKQILAMRMIARSSGLVTAARMHDATTAIDRLPRVCRTVALGVSPHGKGFRLAVRVQQQALLDAPVIDRIRAAARGEIDLRFVGRIRKRQVPWHRRRQRPILIGSSVGHYKVTAGTLGAVVRRRQGDDVLILSNNHVLANEGEARPGDAILQPGVVDGGRRPTDRIGSLSAFVKLSDSRPNRVDAAVAALHHDVSFDPHRLRGLGVLAGLGPADIETGTRVAKIGRTTGVTEGRVTAFEVDNVVVEYDRGDLMFDGQIEIEGIGTQPFSDGGDSGSLIVNRGREAVALLFAGTDTGGRNRRGLTYANPIGEVLRRLRVELLS